LAQAGLLWMEVMSKPLDWKARTKNKSILNISLCYCIQIKTSLTMFTV
jgi:hypothetical protein